MPDNRGVFGLSGYYDKDVSGDIPDRNRESYREYGYFGGGFTPASISTVDRIDYSNDTSSASVRGPLSSAKSGLAATGNSNFGYYGGGANPGPLSTIDRIDYSNDNTSSSVRGPLSLSRSQLAATGNSNFGYFGGGYVTGTTYSTIDRVNYSNDTTIALIRNRLSTVRRFLAATGNSNFGYFGGGYADTSLTFRIQYNNDTNILLQRGSLTLARHALSATGNSNFGYFAGGAPTPVSTVDRIDYSNDTANALLRSPLLISKRSFSSNGNSNFGYFGAGYNFPSPSVFSNIDRIDYSNDTVTAAVRGPSSSAKYDLGATSSASFGGSPVSYLGAPWVATAPYGYWAGGYTNSRIQRLDYTNDTNNATRGGALSYLTFGQYGTSNDKFGYIFGGWVNLTSVNRIDYSNDSANASIRGSLLVGRRYPGATSTKNYAWIGTGTSGNTNINRIDFSNDSVNATTRGQFNQSGGSYVNSGTKDRGYFHSQAAFDVVDYSNDLVVTPARGTRAPVQRFNSTSIGNFNYGYFAGGLTPGPTNYSLVDRLDYSNDTSTTIFRGNLSVARRNLTSTANLNNYGYFGGGYTTGAISTIDRLDFSNDTVDASARGSLLTPENDIGVCSSQAYGGAPNTTTDPIPTYIRANTVWNDSNTLDLPFKRVLGSYGYWMGSGSRVDRVDYSSDTSIASIRGNLSTTHGLRSSFSNKNFGYTVGGLFPAQTSLVNRIEFSNDTSNSLLRSNYITDNYSSDGMGNSKYGYSIGGGNANISTSLVYRLNYSNDSMSFSRRGNLGTPVSNTGTSSIENFGYFAGGGSPGFFTATTIVNRINFNNDTAISLLRGSTTLPKRSHTGTGNDNFGYYGGGSNSVGTGQSSVERIDYSNDTSAASVRGSLTRADSDLAATGNSNFGWFGGGSGPRSTVNRIDYSNDTATASVRGSLSVPRGGVSATTNARNS